MKNLIILIILFAGTIYPQHLIRGKVFDSESGIPLPNANILVKNSTIGTTSDNDGQFRIKDITTGSALIISYIGYQTKEINIIRADLFINAGLTQTIIPSQTVLVKGSLSDKYLTPFVLEKVGRDEIRKKYSLQDIPQFLSTQPSVMSYSENGNGIGYNYISIRGFDQRRISVSVNGIPQNDPEDHNVYWLDFPDILGSTDMIQVQRGAGSGLFSYPAIGGSVNIITKSISDLPGIIIEGFAGSYVTRKYSASFSSGLIGNKYSVYAKLSSITSSGYRDLSWVKFNAYHLSAIRYDENLTTQINLYGGPVADGLAYTGLPKFVITDKDLRKKNYSYWEAEGNQIKYALSRRASEIENFSQPHFEVLNDYEISDRLRFNSALFLVLGNGFFDYDGSWGDTSYYRLTYDNGFMNAQNPGNALIRAEVSNRQYGWIPRLNFSHNNGELIFGGEFRIHRSEHWGNIKFAENLPAGIPDDYQYYYYKGAADIISGFVQENYNISDAINLLGEIQLAYNKYRLFDEKYIGTDFSIKNLFFNPRAGINYRISERQNIFLSFSRVSREPRLKNYYDAAESSGGEVPQFERRPDGSYDFSSPLVHPETMNDIELGTSFRNEKLKISANLFYLLFDNEIIKNGKLDRFGQPVTGNAQQTVHRGIEVSILFKPAEELEFWGNTSYSSNVIKKSKYFLPGNESIDLDGNRISGFPDFTANLGIVYTLGGARLDFTGKYSGEFYSDNYDKHLNEYLTQHSGFVTYTDNKNDAFFTADFNVSYESAIFNSAIPSKLYLRINNLFDKLYSAYAIGQEFFPAAERNYIAGIQIGF